MKLSYAFQAFADSPKPSYCLSSSGHCGFQARDSVALELWFKSSPGSVWTALPQRVAQTKVALPLLRALVAQRRLDHDGAVDLSNQVTQLLVAGDLRGPVRLDLVKPH
jgi:hypothetical protein